ncbi:MAG: cobalt-precorrin-6A reductase [Rhodospirillales bacterium]|nr:cobalt-precorrin-6A reductase [Rhodospirillales bacterium]
MTRKLLILGGTAEGADLARQATAAFGDRVEVISSLAGRTMPSQDLPGAVRSGGFGGVRGLADYLEAEGIGLVVDATHPFAAAISSHAYTACVQTRVPKLNLIRPPWRLPPKTQYIEADTLEHAAQLLPRISLRAFLTVGSGGIEAFQSVKGVWMLVRLLTQPADPLPIEKYHLITGRPPYTVEGETALIREHRIDCIVTKQSGGAATEAKITAARECGIKLLIVRRPFREPGDAVESVEEAISWIEKRI